MAYDVMRLHEGKDVVVVDVGELNVLRQECDLLSLELRDPHQRMQALLLARARMQRLMNLESEDDLANATVRAAGRERSSSLLLLLHELDHGIDHGRSREHAIGTEARTQQHAQFGSRRGAR